MNKYIAKMGWPAGAYRSVGVGIFQSNHHFRCVMSSNQLQQHEPRDVTLPLPLPRWLYEIQRWLALAAGANEGFVFVLLL